MMLRSDSIPASAAIAVPPTPIRCTRLAPAGTRASRAALPESAIVNCFHDQVVNLRPELANRLIVAARMNAIGEHRDRRFTFRFDPYRSPGESEMTHRAPRQQ